MIASHPTRGVRARADHASATRTNYRRLFPREVPALFIWWQVCHFSHVLSNQRHVACDYSHVVCNWREMTGRGNLDLMQEVWGRI